MSQYKATVTQSGINVLTSVPILTGLTVDGKSGWNIKRVRFNFVGPNAVSPVVDTGIILQLNTEIGDQAFTDNDSIVHETISISGVAASTSAFNLPDPRVWISDIGRVTVQPILYLTLVSNGLIAAGVVNVEIEYEIIRLTDLEVMRLLQGGA
jgi:hypothetical protein